MIIFPPNAPRVIQVQLDRVEKIDEEFLHLQAERYFKVHEKLATSNRKDWKVRSIFWGPLLSLIPFIIEWWAIRDNIRRVLPLENFPEIKEMATEYAARGLSGALKNVKEMIDWYPDLVPWKPMVERYFMILEIGRNVRGLLKASQGIERTVIKKTFAEYDGRDISSALMAMEKYDIITKITKDKEITY